MQSREEEDGPRVLARAGGRRVQTRRLGSNDTTSTRTRTCTRIRLVPSSPRLQFYKRRPISNTTTTTTPYHYHSRIRPRRDSNDDDDPANDGDGSSPPTRRRDSRLRICLYAQLPLGRALVTPPVPPRASAPYQQ